MTETYEVYAIRYGTVERPDRQNFLEARDPHDRMARIDYFVWAAIGPDRTFVIDTGFTEEIAKRRNRPLLRCPTEGLRLIGIEAATVRDHQRFVSLQSALNLFSRGALADTIPACEHHDMSFIPYYPLASGMLTGKYRRDSIPSSGTRLTDQVDEAAHERIFSDRAFSRVEALQGWAADHSHTILELAFAWLLAQPTVATVIAGASKPGQAKSNAGAAGWNLTVDQAQEVTDLVANAA